jgi:hypothetical protein
VTDTGCSRPASRRSPPRSARPSRARAARRETKLSGDARRVGDRLVLVPHQLRQRVEEVRRSSPRLVVVRPKRSETMRAYESSLASRSAKATEKVLIGSSTSPLITAVIAAESMPPERNMPSGTSAIRRIARPPRSAPRTPRRASRIRADRRASPRRTGPSTRDGDPPVLPAQRVPGGEARTPANSVSSPTARGWRGSRGGGDIQRRAHLARRQERLDLRGEVQRPVLEVRVVERLDAEAVAREEQLALRAIPDAMANIPRSCAAERAPPARTGAAPSRCRSACGSGALGLQLRRMSSGWL